MARGKTFKQRFLSLMITILMMAALVVPSFPSYAVEDRIDVGQPAYAADGTMTYYNCLGTGTNLYKSIVINYTSVRENGETMILPEVAGFRYETGLSTDSTYIINIPEGKNLVQIAAYIRKIQFKNCQNSSQKINFSVGKELVQYMTFYSEDSQHYYQFIPFTQAKGATTPTVTDPTGKTWDYGYWEWAYYTALNMQYEGLQGYLASVSTIEEDAFIYRTSYEIGWLGGTRMVPGEKDTKNGIPYYKTFTRAAAANTAGTGYWYWAAGPDLNENDGKFFNSTMSSSEAITAADNAGIYNNWNEGEPNNTADSTKNVGEAVVTTLKIGKGYATANRNSKIGTSSPYYVASGYSWNDMKDYNWGQWNVSTDNYAATGFFVEYGDYVKGLTQTALVMKTNFEFKTTTQPLSHIWNLYAANGSDTINMYCTAADPKCSFYAANASALGNTIDLQIKAEDVPYTGKAYNSTTVTGAADIKAAASNNATISSVTYYKTTQAGAVSGGTALTGPPKDIGYYYAAVTVNVRNTVLATNTVTATAVTPFKIYDPDADFDVEYLNNKKDSNVPYQDKVTSVENARSDLEIILATSQDSFAMYKIADMDWDEDEHTVKDITWVSAVQSWLATSNYTTIRSPYDLANGKASSSTIAGFYKDMLRSTNEVTTALEDISDWSNIGASTDSHTFPEEYKRAYATYKDSEGATVSSNANGASKYSITYEGLEFGLYAIVAQDGGTNPYAVTVAAVYPQQSGPNGDFYIQKLFTVYIKEVEPTIDKYINGKKQDIAEIDDTENPIEFRVDFQLPQYKDRLTTGTGSGYRLSFEDTMAAGFSLYEPTEEYRLKFYYTYKEHENDTELQEALIAENGIPTAYSYKFTSSGGTTVSTNNAQDKGTIVYTANPTSDTCITKNTDLKGESYTVRNSRIFESFEWQTNANGTSTVIINFDEPAIRAWKQDVKAETSREVSGFRIRYYATLDKDAVINSNANSNTAYIHYEKDSSGETMTEMHDIVYAYTYGLNIIKIDGSASEPTYLAGAQFKLYKELTGNAIPSTEEAVAAAKADSENYYILEGEDDAPDQYFKKVAMNNGTFKESTTGSGVYDLLESVANAQGITAKGLGDGNYILVETKAPTGYNELAEDIYFEINKLNEAEMALADNSYIWFRELSDNYNSSDITTAVINENACIELDVYNYRGLTLPSTGGMGILLFIIIGTAVMATVLIILLKKRRSLAQM
jgi:LPXTG-motif cell wall-anchored protein